MSHFAKLDDNDVVLDVHRITQDVIDTGYFGNPSIFEKTSYNTRGGVHYGAVWSTICRSVKGIS